VTTTPPVKAVAPVMKEITVEYQSEISRDKIHKGRILSLSGLKQVLPINQAIVLPSVLLQVKPIKTVMQLRSEILRVKIPKEH
jgi:hypothetical protein